MSDIIATPHKVHAVACRNPFTLERVDYTFPPGLSIRQMVDVIGLPDYVDVIVTVDGDIARKELWDVCFPAPGQLVALRAVPTGGGGGKNPLRTVLMLVVMVVAIVVTYGGAAAYLGPAFAAGTFGAYAAGAVVAVGGMLAVNALAPPPTPSLAASGAQSYTDSPTYALTGARNMLQRYGTIPQLLGRHRVVPRFAALPYTELVGDDQYMYLYFAITKGPAELSGHKIGDTRLEEFRDYQIEIFDGVTTDLNGASELYPRAVHQEDMSLLLLNDDGDPATDGWHVRTTRPATTRISIDATAARGMVRIASDGSRHEVIVKLPVQYSVSGENDWQTVEGATSVGIREFTYQYNWWMQLRLMTIVMHEESGQIIPVVGGTYTGGWTGEYGEYPTCEFDPQCYTWASVPAGYMGLLRTMNIAAYLGSPYMEDIRDPDFRYIEFENGKFEIESGMVVTGAQSGATAIIETVNVDAGGWATEDAAGTLVHHSSIGAFLPEETITVEVESIVHDAADVVDFVNYYQVTLADYSTQGAAVYHIHTGEMLFDALYMIGKTTQPVRRSLTWDVPEGQYDVRVRRDTPDSASDSVLDQVLWTAMRSYRDMPPVTEPDLCRVVLVIKGTDQLSGIVDQYSVVAAGHYPDWDKDSEQWTMRASSNPAALYRQALQGPANPRAKSEDEIDLEILAQFHERCVAMGWTFNHYVDYRASVDAVLQMIASAGHAAPGYGPTGKDAVVMDRPQANFAQVFSPRNSWGYRYTKPFIEMPHAWRVRYWERDNDWQETEIIVPNHGYSEETAEIFEELSLPGIDTEALAVEHGLYHFDVAHARPDAHFFNADVEHLTCTRGDRIKYVNEIIRESIAYGRIRQVWDDGEIVTHIVMDVDCPMEGAHGYALLVRDPAAHRLLFVSRDPEHGDDVLRIAKRTELADAPEEGSLALFGLYGRQDIDLLVKNITPGPDHSAQLHCINYEMPAYGVLVLTSTLYPVAWHESMDTNVIICTAGFLQTVVHEHEMVAEALEIETIALTGGELRDPVVDYVDYEDWPAEAMETAIHCTGGQLLIPIVNYEDWPAEAMEIDTIALTGGTMQVVVVEYGQWPAEHLETQTLTLTGGTLG